MAEHSVSYIQSASTVTPDMCQGDTGMTRQTPEDKGKKLGDNDDPKTEMRSCNLQGIHF